MSITVEGDSIVFDAGSALCPLQPFRHDRLASYSEPTTGRLIAAVWRARRVPYMAGEVAYYLCEGVLSPTKSEYDYWHFFGIAGCVLKPHLRSRLGILRTTADVVAALFTPDTAGIDQCPPKEESLVHSSV